MSGFEGEGFGGEGGMGGGFRGRGRGGFRGRGRGRGGRGGGPPEGPIDELKLYVGGLAWAVNDEILTSSFQEYGGLVEVRSARLTLSFDVLYSLPGASLARTRASGANYRLRCAPLHARARTRASGAKYRFVCASSRQGHGCEGATHTCPLRKPGPLPDGKGSLAARLQSLLLLARGSMKNVFSLACEYIVPSSLKR